MLLVNHNTDFSATEILPKANRSIKLTAGGKVRNTQTEKVS